MQQILVIDNHDSFVYNLVQILRETPACRFDIVYNDRVDFTTLHRYDKILLSPGPGIPAEAGQLMQLVHRCENTHAILGVCLGHQAIAQNFGARLRQLPLPKHGHQSTLTLTGNHDPLYEGLPSPLLVGRYHSWVIDPVTLPPALKISARDEDGNIMSYYHETLPLHGLQYHPESIITPLGKDIIHNWLAT